MKHQHSIHVTERGPTLVELLVAMVIGLIGILIITEALLSSDKFKRSTISAGDAQTNGALSLYTMERDIRMAGAGIANSQLLGCTPLQYYWDKAPIGPIYSKPANASSSLPDLNMAPIVITDGGPNPDVITITYTDEDRRMIPGRLRSTMPQPSSELKLDEVAGFTENDLIVIAQPGQPCTMMQVTQVQLGAAIALQHNPGNSAPYNPPGGTSLFPAYTEGALIFNMGKPIVHRYELINGNLHLTNYFMAPVAGSLPLFNNISQLLYDNIVDLQAEYGKDNGAGGGTANDGVVDEFNNITPATSAEWQQVLAVRIGLLARSSNLEKPTGSPSTCSATTATPSWAGGNFSVPGGIPSCYKYRVFETIIPLRNMIWRES